MAPRPKDPVPDKLARRLVAAADALEAAYAERDAAIMAALKAGGSTREISKLVRMENSSVFHLGRRYGWPDEAEQARRAAAEAERHRFDHLFPPSER